MHDCEKAVAEFLTQCTTLRGRFGIFRVIFRVKVVHHAQNPAAARGKSCTTGKTLQPPAGSRAPRAKPCGGPSLFAFKMRFGHTSSLEAAAFPLAMSSASSVIFLYGTLWENVTPM